MAVEGAYGHLSQNCSPMRQNKFPSGIFRLEDAVLLEVHLQQDEKGRGNAMDVDCAEPVYLAYLGEGPCGILSADIMLMMMEIMNILTN